MNINSLNFNNFSKKSIMNYIILFVILFIGISYTIYGYAMDDDALLYRLKGWSFIYTDAGKSLLFGNGILDADLYILILLKL